MIIDKLSNLSAHVKDQELCSAIAQFLGNASNLLAGKYPIKDGTFANVLEYTTKTFDNIKMEAHVKFIDLQYMVDGCETVLRQHKTGNQPIDDYNPDKDVIHYSPISYDAYVLNKGEFAIMLPDDLHQCICKESPIAIKKIVVKIPVQSF